MLARVVASVILLTTTVASIADTPLEPNEYVVFHHHDALGNTVVTTGANGEVLWFEQTDPYGKTLGRRNVRGSGLAVDPFHEEEGRSRPGYTGHVRDGASGMTYMQARHYSPDLGRFLSNDPIGVDFGNPQSFNRYAYANNNPYRYVDPDGRLAVPLIVLGIGAAVSAYDSYQTYRSEGAAAAARSAAVGAALTATGAGAAKLAGTLAKRGNLLERMTSGRDGVPGGADDAGKLSGQLRDSVKGKGNFGIGSGTREQSDALGDAWVGKNPTTASDGRTLVSEDKLRQYRSPNEKPNSNHSPTGVQSNFEQRYEPSGQWQSNGHLDITD